MNQRKIWFAGIVTSAIGVFIGLVLSRIVETPYTSANYQRLGRIYMLVCGTGGFVVGTTQEALRQMQAQRDREEDQDY
ncbi:hypothetical protein S7335_1477 [Synechococcus sp. PCC 7335]|uniref:hypothetical protein n=1 Tax=Synechococcus sp. (strain ATCC 29403 / PCC 7335) TaxID=91464 RepID=UPI00017EC427|nr:hypothetical protein [Synechococcus sp. PCC 7335]EDX83780.1 hypothetical protein S7335_1477 [Synechococcus sp. PCC 7335]